MSALNIAIISFLVVFIVSAILSRIGKGREIIVNKPIENYLLAGRLLPKSSVISLLLSTSFGLNPLFFQIWLGYTVGAWGLVTQGAWALGFLYFAKYSNSINGHNSLHDFLGKKFGLMTKICASIFSILGIMFMLAWESRIGNSSIEDLLGHDHQLSSERISMLANWLVIFITAGSMFYTLLGGLKGNANADIMLNILKIFTVTGLSILLLSKLADTSLYKVESFFPSITTMQRNLGWWGLLTNVIFSFVWQFVDNSAWQSTIAGSHAGDNATRSSLNWSALVTFLAPGVIGTLLGICLAMGKDVTQDNVFSTILELSPLDKSTTLFVLFLTITAGIMSMMDGLFLTTSYTLIIDIIYPKRELRNIDRNTEKSELILLYVRISLVLIAATSLWAINWLCEHLLGLSPFDYVYIMIISQLSLFGVTIMGLRLNRNFQSPQWLSILIAASVGFAAAIMGSVYQIQWIADGAGTFAVIISIIAAFLVFKIKREEVII